MRTSTRIALGLLAVMLPAAPRAQAQAYNPERTAAATPSGGAPLRMGLVLVGHAPEF